MSRNKKRKTSCRVKVAHPTRESALQVLAQTLPAGKAEEMHPYPCFLCGAWHNGHEPVERLAEYEPRCGCRHLAMDHRRAPERGCFVCGSRCASNLEDCYRTRIKYYADAAEFQRRLKRFMIQRYPQHLRSTIIGAFTSMVKKRFPMKRRGESR